MNQNTFNLAVALGMVVADANVGYKFVVGHKSLGKIQRTASGKAKKENRQKKKAANESRRINRQAKGGKNVRSNLYITSN